MLVTRDIHTNTGILIRPMPGARMFRMVTTKLNEAASDATPRISKPSAQKVTPSPGLYTEPVRLA